MNERATENNLSREEFEQLLDAYVDTIIDSMSMEDFRQYVRNDMNDFLYKCSESELINDCLLYTSPSPRDLAQSRMPSSG